MRNGGEVAQRGFIFQSIIAMIECLERDDWDEIKIEPKTEHDKVDIMLYKDGLILTAIQVKSSENPFEKWEVEDWLIKLKSDVQSNHGVCLYLVGDSFTTKCEKYIKDNSEVKTVSFKNLKTICTDNLIKYIRKAGIIGDVRLDDLKLIDASLFSEIHKNSISKSTVSRVAFEIAFRKAMPVHMIPLCLTPIPAISQVVDLIGRDDIKHTIRIQLDEKSLSVLVCGLGGIGKTALMQHICHDLLNEGNYVAWIESGDSLQDDLLLLRTGLGIPESDNADTAFGKIVDELRSRLRDKLYLFIDDLSRILSKNELNILLSLGIHVMISSRIKHEYFPTFQLDTLSKESAIDMFYAYYKGDTFRTYHEDVWEIINSVHSHTLLVELLAKAAWKKGGTLNSFKKELYEKGFFDVFKRKVWNDHDSQTRTIEDSIMKLYKISDLSIAQQHIMKLFTIFTPEKEIYYKICEWANLDMDAMDDLIDFGWLDRSGLENGYRIHQIVKDSLTRQLESKGEDVNLEDYGNLIFKVGNVTDYLSSTVTYSYLRERIILTEDVVTYLGSKMDTYVESLSDNEKVSSKKKAWINNITSLRGNLSSIFYAHGNYKKALEYTSKNLAIRERIFGIKDVSTATTYNNIASIYYELGNYDKALYYFDKTLFVRKLILGTNHTDTATTYNNMASVYDTLGKYDEALKCSRKALSIREHILGSKHPYTAESYNIIAAIYSHKGDYNQALKYFGKALSSNEITLGTEHPSTANTYNNMAYLLDLQGKYEEALKYYDKAVIIQSHIFGEEHPATATTYNNIAVVYTHQENYEKALEYYSKALSIRQQVFGTEHPETATTYDTISMAYNNQGNYDKALEFCNKALIIRLRVFGAEHPATAETYGNLGGIYLNKRDFEKALEYFKKALDIQKQVLGTNHPNIALTYNNMGGIFNEKGNKTKAYEHYCKALNILKKSCGENHPLTKRIQHNINLLLRE